MSYHKPSNPVPSPTDRIKAKRSAKVQFASTVLMCEAFLVLFATLVVHGLASVPSVWAGEPPSLLVVWAVGGVLAVVLLVLGRRVDGPGGYVAGSVVQVPVVLTGFAVPMMFGLGAVFVVLWVVALRLGARIDREREAYDSAHPETAPNVE